MVEASTPPNPADEGGSRPIPDPTVLTTDALRREIAGLEKLIDTKLDAAEKLSSEKFQSTNLLMERAEEQRREQKSDTKMAVDAALDSQKEATAKMEKSISDQITSLRSNFETSINATQASMADLKDRVTVMESVKQGQTEQRVETRAITAGQMTAIGVGITIIVIVLNIVLFVMAQDTSIP